MYLNKTSTIKLLSDSFLKKKIKISTLFDLLSSHFRLAFSSVEHLDGALGVQVRTIV